MMLLAVYLPFLQDIFETVSLGGNEWLIILILALIKIIFIEIVKYYFIVKNKIKSQKLMPLNV